MSATLSTISPTLFNLLQKTACEVGTKKPIYCQCKTISCYFFECECDNCSNADCQEPSHLVPILDECENCGRLVPWCFMGSGDELCNECWGKQQSN